MAYDKRDCIRELQRVAEKVDGTPAQADFNEHAEFSATTVHYQFGSWNNAVKEAGFRPNQCGGGERGRTTVASPDREVGTVEVFEAYWVRGEAKLNGEYLVNLCNQRGIPTRSEDDSQRLRRGEVEVPELWSEYLSEFQYELARELRTMMLADYRDGVLME